MTEPPKMYIAGIGMITAVGADTAMTATAVRAGVSGYRASRFMTEKSRQPITMARIPDEVFLSPEFDIDEGSFQNRIIIMAMLALREAISGQSIKKPIPLILSVPEAQIPWVELKLLIANLAKQKDLPLHADLVRCIDTGRAAGIEGLELARHYLLHQKADFVLIGGSDSYADVLRLRELDAKQRLLTVDAKDGFAPGEGAGFLLLTARPELALVRNGRIIALNLPGIAEEPGHLHSKQPYRGDGLDQAFKKALGDSPSPNWVHSIYSSMNGENHWAKEYGVAYVRNRDAFRDPVGVEHPADCFGDLGCAMAPILIGLAAAQLLNQPTPGAHLVYSSSDFGKRGAVVVESLAAPTSVQTQRQTFRA